MNNFPSLHFIHQMKHRCAVILLGLVTLVVCKVPIAYGQTYTQQATDAVSTLQGTSTNWYSSDSGLYASPADWWHAANSMTVLPNYERVAGNNSYYSVLVNTFTMAQQGKSGHPNFENPYYDDTGWWALAWIDAYDLTGKPSYLSMAETMFTYLTSGWTTTECGGGGMNWTTKSTYQNAIANELFLTVAAKLANRTTGSTSSTYRTWANNEWTWFKNSGMINSSNLINDGLKTSPTCGNNNGTVWTYNQGVILGGLVELAQANNDPTLIQEAVTLANATLASSLVNSNGILAEPSVSGGDTPQFKGIFVRNLMDLYKATNYNKYKQFIVTNANSISSKAQSDRGHEFGALWQGPFDSADATRQTSALDAIVAALAVQGRNASGPIQTNGFGSAEMFAVDGHGSVWHDWQKVGNGGNIPPANWAGWSEFSMGSVVAKAGPAVAMNSVYQQNVFVPTSGDVYVVSESSPAGGWGSWTDMGSTSSGLTGLVARNSPANGGLYVFGRDSSGDIWYASKSNPNSSWSSFTELTGKTVQSGYTVGENAGTGYLEVFGVDSIGRVWTNMQTGLTTWSGWSSLPGEGLQGYLTVCQNMSGRLQVFGIDTSNTNVWTNWQSTDDGSWQSSWQSHGNVGGGVFIKPGFVCGQNANGNLQLFGVGSDGNMYSIWQGSSGWTTTWTSLGGSPLNPYLMVNSSADGRIIVFGVSTASPYNVYGNWETAANATTWNSWTSWRGGGYTFYSGQP